MAKWFEIQDSNSYQSLNLQEQVAVQQRYFDNVISDSNSFRGLRQTEQLAVKNKFFSQGAMGQQQIDQQETGQLLEQLGGFVPLTREQQAKVFQPTAKTIQQTKGTQIELIERQKAFDELLQKGLTRRQIELSLDTQRILDRPRIGRPVGGIAGAIATTAIAGRFIPGPIDDAAILAALIAGGGAGIGGVAGEAIQTGIEEKRLISRREALTAFAIEASTEIGIRAVVGGGKLLLSPFIRKTVPEAASLVDDFAKVGGNFSPTELDKRMSLSLAERFSRGGFGVTEIFEKFEKRQGKAVFAFADNIIESIGEGVARQTPEEIGEIFASGITRPGGRIFNIFDDLITPLYRQVDDLAQEGARAGLRQARIGGRAIRGETGRFIPARELQRIRLTPRVSTKSLKAFAQKHLATDSRLNKQFLSPAGRSKLQKILGLSDELSFSDMRTLRSAFLKDIRKLARDVDQSQGLIKQLAGITDDAIFDPRAAQGLNPEALNLLRNTNALYKAGKKGIEETFSESLAKRLLRNPSNVIKEVFPSNNPKAIRLLRKSLIEPISGRPSAEGKVLWNQLRQAWLADVVDQATKEGVAKPKVFNNLLRKLGDKSFREMFPETEMAKNVRKIQSVFEIAGKTPPSGASLFSRSAQAGGVILMYRSYKEGDFIGFTAGAALAIGPVAFAKLATTPGGVKLLTAGFRMKPGASGLVPLVIRMIRLREDVNRQEQKTLSMRETRKLRRAGAKRLLLTP